MSMAYFRDRHPTEFHGPQPHKAFPLPGECDRLLSVRFAGVLANCHFFMPEELEFDIDPREVTGREQLNALFEFMRCMAEGVGKEVILTR